jgi:GNAT superfamily N-acetyltransferase
MGIEDEDEDEDGNFRFQISDFRFQISDFRFQISKGSGKDRRRDGFCRPSGTRWVRSHADPSPAAASQRRDWAIFNHPCGMESLRAAGWLGSVGGGREEDQETEADDEEERKSETRYLVSYIRLLHPAPTSGSYIRLVLFHLEAIRLRMDFSIADATAADIPVLLELIRELACFERLEHEIEATVQSFHDSLFGPRPAAGALMARTNGQPVGYAIYFFTFSSFIGRPGIWLEDVYVRPTFRSQGLGRALIQAVARIGVERNCGRFEWTALNWNNNAIEFYRNLGAKVMDEWHLFRLNADGLRRVAAGEESESVSG